MTGKQSEILKKAFNYLADKPYSDEDFFHKIIVNARDLELYFNKDVATQYRSLAITLYDAL